ncbi:hypothetical protein Ciccas_005600 [Cichlidogyrus casuarinus]|uniref:Deoxyhypusine hydroxylase n=1 Tax=Cichlidogyrus casuarinus TaxID=1844966 RepID=A0ABD2Q892_9PLAT
MSVCEIKPVSQQELAKWSDIVLDPSKSLVQRAKALWGLRHAREPEALEYLGKFLINIHENLHPAANELLQHEAAYCLGQRGDAGAVPILINVITDDKHAVIVRHEAAEALAALAGRKGVDLNELKTILSKYQSCNHIELAETCQIGLERLAYVQSISNTESKIDLFNNIVDPAHPLDDKKSPKELKEMIMKSDLSLYIRYRALFTLRNEIADLKRKRSSYSEEARLLSSCLTAPGSALLRHEIAFVLGELSLPDTTEHLCLCVENLSEHPMVRHEAAEALGDIMGNSRVENLDELASRAENCLKNHLVDEKQVVRESCVLALDVADYISSEDFNYCSVPQQLSA